jgi:hypothetical protein
MEILLIFLPSVITSVIGAVMVKRAYESQDINPGNRVLLGAVVGFIGLLIGLAVIWIGLPKGGKYALYRGGPKRLKVLWNYGFHEVVVKLDNVELGRNSSKTDLKQGWSLQLPEGSILVLKRGAHPVTAQPIPVLTLNGKAVPGSVKDPGFDLNLSAEAFVFGGIVTLLGSMLYSNANPVGYSVFLIVLGFTAIDCGIHIKRMSRRALEVGVVVAAIGVITFVLGLTQASGIVDFADGTLSLIESISFLFGVIKGFSALDYLKKEKTELLLTRAPVFQDTNSVVREVISNQTMQAPTKQRNRKPAQKNASTISHKQSSRTPTKKKVVNKKQGKKDKQ